MKIYKFLLITLTFSLILITGCRKDLRTDTGAPGQLQTDATNAAKQAIKLASLKAKFNKLKTSLPAGFPNKLKKGLPPLAKQHVEYKNMVLRALKATGATCNDNTNLNQWLDGQLSDWNDDIISYVLDFAMLDLPTYDALVFENSSANQYFGKNGEYSHIMSKTFKDLKRFWNIRTDNIVLAAMHGRMLRNRNKVIRTYEAVYGLDSETATAIADFVVELVEVIPQYRKGDHPIFTFNSFAIDGFPFPPVGVIPPKIIMGDGIMEGFTAIGFGDVAPQAILAHEYGHQIQFQLNLFTNETGPEATRRTELMADAYSAYYLSHARGASMQWKRVKQFLQVFFNIGDCSFTSEGHHGTPTQRMASAEWAYNIANNAQKQGHILTAQKFTALFEAQLPKILAH